jgi:RNA recognition motif-containing protein
MSFNKQPGIHQTGQSEKKSQKFNNQLFVKGLPKEWMHDDLYKHFS